MDTLLAARLQMALSLIFHIFFAAVGIGLSLLVVLVERNYLRSDMFLAGAGRRRHLLRCICLGRSRAAVSLEPQLRCR